MAAALAVGVAVSGVVLEVEAAVVSVAAVPGAVGRN